MLLEEYFQTLVGRKIRRRTKIIGTTQERYSKAYSIVSVDSEGINYDCDGNLNTIPWKSQAGRNLYELVEEKSDKES